MNTLVWIVVLHYQGIETTKACLSSLKTLAYKNFRVLLTNNGSPDGAVVDALAASFCDYLKLPENLGFAGGANASIQYCLEQQAEWIWLLNNDTLAYQDSLDELMAVAQTKPQAGLLGASVYTPGSAGFVLSGSGEIDFFRAKTYERGLISKRENYLACPWLSGCNLLIRAKAFLHVGGFDEKFFLYFEDTDLCQRLIKSGWQCLLVPKAKIAHLGGASTSGRLNIWRSYYYTRNRLLFFLRYRKGLAALPVLFFIALHIIRHCLILPFRGINGKRQLKAELLGLRDYICNNLGQAKCLDF